MSQIYTFSAFLGAFGILCLGLPQNGPQTGRWDLLSTRIVGGVDAPEGFAPHMVALVFLEVQVMQVCGGSIVTPNHVLTAAHCIEVFISWWSGELTPSFRGVIGSNRFDSTANLIQFSEYIMHPNYNAWTIKFDIGVLTASEEIIMSDRVAVIALDYNWIDGGEDSYVTGWGDTRLHPQTSKLQYLNVRTLTPKQCLEGVEEASQIWLHAPHVDSSQEICTLKAAGHGMCHGDSGSGLVSKLTGKQIGIVSWGFPCAQGFPDVFVRISGFKDWLLPLLRIEA